MARLRARSTWSRGHAALTSGMGAVRPVRSVAVGRRRCDVCGGGYKVNRDGSLRAHVDADTGQPCAGSGRVVP